MNAVNSLSSGIDDNIISLNKSQYCFVNETTIRVSDNFTSELQDIVNKTEHVIISTTINSTVIFIAPSNGSRCSSEDDNIGISTSVYVVLVFLDAISLLIAVSNITLHLLIKELRTVSGILIMMMCGSVVVTTIITFTSFTYGYITEEEQINSVCIVFVSLAYYLLFVYQAVKLGILFHFTYLMYKSYRTISSDDMGNKLCILIKYTTFVLVTSTVCFCFVILFELAATGEVYSGLFCINVNDDRGGDDVAIFIGISAIVLIVFVASELTVFSIGLVLYFLTNKKNCCRILSANLRVACALAATVGINMITLIALSGARVSGELYLPIITSCTIVEQLTLFIVFLSSHKAWTKTKHAAVTLTRSLSRLSVNTGNFKETNV